ncbi:hypothetical protein, partial [Ruegeria atlantica]|uniref:hypothetical protein n=1 Tax=Ruegeria atlantica TaxID=81569 RepID=UPI001C2C7415
QADHALTINLDQSDEAAQSVLWEVKSTFDTPSGQWVYKIHLDRARLKGKKLRLAECATCLANSMDQVMAGMAQANGGSRRNGGYYPFRLDLDDFRAAVRRAEVEIGSDFAAKITEHHLGHRLEWPHVKAMKELSNSGKHWELKVPKSSSHAIAVNAPNGRQKILQIPEGAFDSQDEFEFYRGPERLPESPMTIVLKHEISGLPAGLPKSPDLILESAFRYVENLVASAFTAVPRVC